LATVDDIAVLTSENVRLNYTLATMGSRAAAFLADLLIVILLISSVTIVFSLLGMPLSMLSEGPGPVISFLEAIYIFTVAAIFWGYYFFFEWINWGQTPGKQMLGIRVSGADGGPAGVVACAVRNVIRIVDLILAGFGVTFFIMIFTPRYQRLGDLAAGTVVIKTRKLTFDEVYAAAVESDHVVTREAERAAAAMAYASNGAYNGTVRIRIGDAERILIQKYLERRDSLPENVRKKLRTDLAKRIRAKVPGTSIAELPDEQLIEAAHASP
jgi:uncharacterized RDD family membrane protein YckC